MIYADIYNGPPAHYGNATTAKRYVAIHNTSNDASAEVEASYAKRREDSVSSHYYVDSNSIVQSLDTKLKAWHAGSSEGNSQAIAYEITGTNGKTRAWWMANVAWPLLARQIAVDCKQFGIEPRLLTVAEIKAGKLTGIITHDQMRQAWGGTTHDDPGPNFPLDHLLTLVQAEMGDDIMTIPEVNLTRGKRAKPKPVGDRDAGTQLDDVWAHEVLGKSAVDGAKSERGLQLDRIEKLAGELPTVEVDLDALADKVADRLAAKLALGFVPATPTGA